MVLERLRDRALGLAQSARAGDRGWASGRPSASTMNSCASPDRGNPPRSHEAQTTPPASPEKPTSSPASPQRAHEASSGANPAAKRQLQPEGERRAEAGGAVGAAEPVDRLGPVENRQVAAEQVVGGEVRLLGVAEAQHRVAGARRGPQRRPVGSQVGVRGDRVRRGHRAQIAAALVEDQVEPKERLQPPAEARARLAHALGDRPDPPPRGAVEVQDPIRLAVADAAQDDRLGLELAGPRAAKDCPTGRT